MKALVCKEPGTLEYATIPEPVLKNDHAIIKIKRVGICGTDLHAFEGTQPYFTYPRILGHELSGELVDGDNTTDFISGEVVTIIPYFNCGNCIACLRGKPNCCVNMKVCGVHVDGGMVEYLSVPSSSLVQSHGLTADELALLEPLAIGAHGVRRAMVEEEEFVLVIGAGPIGLGTMEFARIAGAKVIALDLNQQRLNYCREKLKVEHTIHAATADVLGTLREITNGNMPTVVIDATGSLKAINNGFQYLAHSGRYVLIGLQKGDIAFSHPEFHKREATLMSSRNATRQDFELVINSIKAGKIKPEAYITHRVDFDSVRDVFSSWLNPESGVIKAMIEFNS
jgi:2-desacetyl-2-hydroxyethyl bacteriochlorophyllide A dehydrogenase